MVRQRQADHEVGYGEVEHKLVGNERGQAPAQRDGEDGERVAAHDENHQRAVDDAPRPEVVQVRGLRTRPLLGRVPSLLAAVTEYKVHTIAGRARQRPPLRVVRRRDRTLCAHHLTIHVTYHSRYVRTHKYSMPLEFAHFPWVTSLVEREPEKENRYKLSVGDGTRCKCMATCTRSARGVLCVQYAETRSLHKLLRSKSANSLRASKSHYELFKGPATIWFPATVVELFMPSDMRGASCLWRLIDCPAATNELFSDIQGQPAVHKVTPLQRKVIINVW